MINAVETKYCVYAKSLTEPTKEICVAKMLSLGSAQKLATSWNRGGSKAVVTKIMDLEGNVYPVSE